MRSINKRELFLQSWGLFKGNLQFLINVGVPIFLVQILIPNLLDSLFSEINLQYVLYRLAYLLVITGITLGVTVQLIKITRLMVVESFTDIFNYFHKIKASILGSLLVGLVLVTLGYLNLLRSASGRSFLAVRDSEVSARALGVNVARAKTLAFSLSCAITGLAGALYAHLAQAVNYESFLVLISITLLLQVVIGGLGSVHGAFFGAILVVLLPQLIAIARDFLDNAAGIKIAAYPGMDTALFALLILLMVIYEPRGLYGVWFKVRTWLQLFPLYRKGMFRRTRTYLKTERQR